MGCCESTIKPPNSKSPELPAPLKLHDSVEEETVKEVVSSENPKNPIHKKSGPVSNPARPNNFHSQKSGKDPLPDDAVSETTASSLSSTVTRECDGDAARQARRRAQPKQRPEWNAGPGRERAMGRSPTRNEHSSPGKRAGSRSNSGPLKTSQKGLSYNGEGREMVERRSRSPGGNRSARIERTSSNRVNRGSLTPDRVRVPESGERVVEGRVDDALNDNGEENRDDDESLDNPVVSLECFIFL